MKNRSMTLIFRNHFPQGKINILLEFNVSQFSVFKHSIFNLCYTFLFCLLTYKHMSFLGFLNSWKTNIISNWSLYLPYLLVVWYLIHEQCILMLKYLNWYSLSKNLSLLTILKIAPILLFIIIRVFLQFNFIQTLISISPFSWIQFTF